MFSRLFGASKSAAEPAKRTEESRPTNANTNAQAKPPSSGRAFSPAATESASIGASAAPGSPSRVGARTPSPIPLPGSQDMADPEPLRDLLKSCPTKTVHAYMLSQLEVASPSELRALSSFLAALSPPQKLHCVRCHKWYYEVENDDRSCTMAHDDDSAEVEHVGYGNKRGGAYETRWDCCGKTVEGSGDLGPPSGWCYEGKHTIDRKRARYRNDSTATSDMLQSCDEKGCFRKRVVKPRSTRSVVQREVPDDARSVRSMRSTRSVDATAATPAPKKRGRKRKNVDDEDDNRSVITDAASVREPSVAPTPKRRRRGTITPSS